MRLLLLLTLSTLSFTRSYSQCDCSELLKYGLYNHFSSNSSVDKYSKVTDAVSNLYQQSNNGSSGASAQYKLFSGSVNKSQASSLNKLTTQDKLSEQESNEILNTSSSFIDPNMVSAYKSCLELCNRTGLKFNVDFPTDNRAERLGITVKFSPSDFGDRRPKIRTINISPVGCFECIGSMADKAKDSSFLNNNETYTLICTRKISENKFKQPGSDKYVYATDAFFNIETDMGIYRFRVPALEAKPELIPGIGEIIASMLPVDKFIATYGSDWVLADGRISPEGSRYKLYVGDTLPDLRGVFLRGKNFDRSTSVGNPENDLELGAYQPDLFLNHNHGLTQLGIGGGETNNKSDNVRANYTNSVQKKTDNVGGSETRPRNVTVNYFIKIN